MGVQRRTAPSAHSAPQPRLPLLCSGESPRLTRFSAPRTRASAAPPKPSLRLRSACPARAIFIRLLALARCSRFHRTARASVNIYGGRLCFDAAATPRWCSAAVIGAPQPTCAAPSPKYQPRQAHCHQYDASSELCVLENAPPKRFSTATPPPAHRPPHNSSASAGAGIVNKRRAQRLTAVARTPRASGPPPTHKSAPLSEERRALLAGGRSRSRTAPAARAGAQRTRQGRGGADAAKQDARIRALRAPPAATHPHPPRRTILRRVLLSRSLHAAEYEARWYKALGVSWYAGMGLSSGAEASIQL